MPAKPEIWGPGDVVSGYDVDGKTVTALVIEEIGEVPPLLLVCGRYGTQLAMITKGWSRVWTHPRNQQREQSAATP